MCSFINPYIFINLQFFAIIVYYIQVFIHMCSYALIEHLFYLTIYFHFDTPRLSHRHA